MHARKLQGTDLTNNQIRNSEIRKSRPFCKFRNSKKLEIPAIPELKKDWKGRQLSTVNIDLRLKITISKLWTTLYTPFLKSADVISAGCARGDGEKNQRSGIRGEGKGEGRYRARFLSVGWWNAESCLREQWWTINYRGGGIVVGCVKCAFEPCAKRQSRNYASKRGAALLNRGWRLVSGRVMIENTLPSLVDPRNEKRSVDVGQVSRYLWRRRLIRLDEMLVGGG